MEDSDGDPVVAELDVYLANDLAVAGTQACLLQYPLRPPWRPYDIDQVTTIKYKPVAGRMEVSVPLDTQQGNHNEEVEDRQRMQAIKLRSTKAESKAAYAVGRVEDGKLVLVPVDFCLQLKPSLSHMDEHEAGEAAAAAAEEEDEDKVQTVEVQVKKRETEKQQQARLNSYAYLQQKEEEEPWTELRLHSQDSGLAESIWKKYVAPTDKELPMDMSRGEYLSLMVPSASQVPGAASAAGDALASPKGAAGAGQKPSADTLAALSAALGELFQKHAVCSLKDIRKWLQESCEHKGARDLAFLPDTPLQQAITSDQHYVCIRRMYVQRGSGTSTQDNLRRCVIDLLRDRESFRKADLVNAFKAKHPDGNFSETLATKVCKELCTSYGNQWKLKQGVD